MNLAHIIEGHDADAVALVSSNAETTYGDLGTQVAAMRGGLAAWGVERGDHVVILCGNRPMFVVAYLAAVGLGAVAIPLNPQSPRLEIERELDVVEPKAAVVGPTAAAAWSQIDPAHTESVAVVVTAESVTLPESSSYDSVSYDELLASEPVDVVDVEPDDIAVMMFTSGTAGPPKAAMLSHRNLIRNLEQSESSPDTISAGDVVYGILPLFHIFGLNVQLGASLDRGATVVLVQRFDPATAIQSIVERKVTIIPGVPTMWTAFSHFEDLPADTFEHVRIAYSGATRLSGRVRDQLFERFNLAISEGYGLTEAAPVVTSSVGINYRPGSVGRSLDGVEVRIVGDDGRDVPVGDAGEVWVRGDNVFAGYYRDPEATERVLADGWLRTGDIGLADDDGYLYLVDRSKDLVIVSGFNVYPAEVEEVIAQHDDIAEVGVLGVPHPHTGEAVKAYVVLEPDATLDEEAVIDFASEYLARYKCPTKVLFVDQLPRNASGKLVRRELEGTVIGAGG